MTARRRLLVTASAAVALGALTACETPSPIVTVVNAGQSTYAEAVSFCFEDQDPVEANCASRDAGDTVLEIVGGQTVGVDVSKEVVEAGWFIELSDPAAAEGQQEPQRSEVQDGHYFTFTAPNLPEDGELLLTVRSLDEESPEQTRGEWRFTLVPRA